MRSFALAGSLCATTCSGAHFTLFLLTGQSNSLGTTAGGEADPSPGSDPADARIRFFWHNVADASTSLGDSNGDFTNLCAQQGGYYPGSATHWGPEIAFGRALYRSGLRDFGIVKASRGGGGNTNWSKADGGHMYTLLTGTVAQAAAALAVDGHTCEVAGLLYLQGESDTTAEAAVASNRLAALVANLRAELPNAANMRLVIGGIAAAGATRDTVRAQQAGLAAADPTIDAFATLDLQSQLYDGLHFDKAAKLTVGQRYAQAFLDAGTVTPRYGRLAFIGDSITQGGNGHPSYRYELFKRLATNHADFTFAGSVTGAYAWSSVSTPSWAGRAFTNAHDGHWGWRAAWSSGRAPLPAGRYNVSNLGCGTLSNWTGQSASYVAADAGPLPYAGAAYQPDTAVVMIGINDLADGSPTNQVAADAANLVRTLQAARSNVAVHVASVTHVGSGHSLYPALNATIDAYNARLAALAPTWSTNGSAVFFADVTTGFDADAMTYDNVHPNAAGEAFLGGRLAAALGLPSASTDASGLPQKESSAFASRFNGDAIWSGSAWTNGWAEGGAGAETLENGDDFRFTASGSGEYVFGESEDGLGSLSWSDGYGSDWTLEVRLRVRSAANGLALWAGEGENKPLTCVTIYGDRTTSYSGRFTNTVSNGDGLYHVFRVAYRAGADTYYAWRDGALLTAPEGAAADIASNGNAEWLFLGDYTSAAFGDSFDVTIDYVRYDLTGAFAPLPGPQDATDGPSLADVFVGGDGHYNTYRVQAVWPSLTGTLLAFAEGRASISDQAQNDMVLKRSFDCGLTWEPLQLLHDDGMNSLNNPCITQDALTGRLFLMYQRYPYGLNENSVVSGNTGDNICRCFLLTSDDDGATWSAPQDITSQVKPPAPADSICSGPGAGIQLRHPGADGVPGTADDRAGRLITPFNHGEPGSVWRVFAAYSDDHGATWAYGADAPAGSDAGYGNEIQMVERADGRVLLNARNQGGLKYRKVAASADFGATWSPLADDTELIEPTCCASVARLTDPLDSQLSRILYAGPYSQASRVNGHVWLSADDGDTWPTHREIYTGSYAYSTLAALADGRIGVLFERDSYTKISFSRFPLAWLSRGADSFVGGYPRVTVLGGASAITATSAVLRATLTSTGTAATAVSFYWGASDGGSNAAAWSRASAPTAVSATLPAPCAFAASGLTPDAAVFYRACAANAHGAVWSELMTFRTDNGDGITATNGAGAAAVGVGTATLSGGADEAGELRLYFGAADGGSDPSAWQTHFDYSLAAAGNVAHAVTGLLYGARYYYRAFATNALGGDWADRTATFTTERAPLTSAQPLSNNYGNYAGQSVRFADLSAGVTSSPPAAAMPPTLALTAFSFWRQAGDNGAPGPLHLNVYTGKVWSSHYVGSSTNTVDFRALADGQKGTWLFDALPLDRNTLYWFLASSNAAPGNIATVRIRVQGGNPAAGELKDTSGNTASAGYDARYEAVAELPAALACAPATQIGARAATLRGSLTGAAAVYHAVAYWGPAAESNSWAHSAYVGCFTNTLGLALSLRAEGLAPDRAYRFAWRATNAVHELVSAAALFETQSGSRLLVR
jgi:sialidase-1